MGAWGAPLTLTTGHYYYLVTVKVAMLTVERQSSSVSVRAVPRLQSVHVATSVADAAVGCCRWRRSSGRQPATGRAAVPREPRPTVRRRLRRRHAHLRRPVQLPERAEQPHPLPAPAAAQHNVRRHSYVAAGNALYRRRRRRRGWHVAVRQPGVAAESTQRRCRQRRRIICRRHDPPA